MKASVYLGPEQVALQDVDEPTVGDGQVLIKVARAGLCGTDLHIYKWDEWAQQTIKTPVTIGHE